MQHASFDQSFVRSDDPSSPQTRLADFETGIRDEVKPLTGDNAFGF
jgi:hypothetical protein